jgi:excisionase family DNA binding protein
VTARTTRPRRTSAPKLKRHEPPALAGHEPRGPDGHEPPRLDGQKNDGVTPRRVAVERLITATTGLAATIAVTEELIQRRAELLRIRESMLAQRDRTRQRSSIVSLAEAARRTGRHPEVLRRWCTEGRIPAIRVGRTWAITAETLNELLAHSARSRPRFATSERA